MKTANEKHIDVLKNKMQEVNTYSASMCTAKWLQTTLYLHNGHNHSCHHPKTHKVPLDEIEKNPSALHNTSYKKKQRWMMKNNIRPEECEYCWNIEDLNQDYISDRSYKTTDDSWSWKHWNQIKKSQWDQDINPSYLEIAFDNTCNFKCSYCSPSVSSSWLEEVKHQGPYQLSYQHNNLEWEKQQQKLPIPNREKNEYVEAFWKWWPNLEMDLDVLRITGGEPLLSKNTWKLMKKLENTPNKNLNFAINSNLGIDDVFVDKLIQSHNAVSKKVKSFIIYTSAEAIGKQCEYIRYGMHWKKFSTNVEKILSQTDATVSLMITFNILSVTSFREFLEWILFLRRKYNTDPATNRIPFMISYLRWPKFMDVRLLPKHLKEKYLKEIVQCIEDNQFDHTTPGKKDQYFFYLEEMDQINRLYEYAMTESESRNNDLQDLKKFLIQHDERRNTNYLEVFPELRGIFD